MGAVALAGGVVLRMPVVMCVGVRMFLRAVVRSVTGMGLRTGGRAAPRISSGFGFRGAHCPNIGPVSLMR